MVDPDSRVSGKGLETLQKNGVQVDVAVEGEACIELNKAFIHRIATSRPYSIAGMQIQRSNFKDGEFKYDIPTRAALEEIFPKAIPDVDTIVISAGDLQKWGVVEMTLPTHVHMIVTALDKTNSEIKELKRSLMGLNRKIILLIKAKGVNKNEIEGLETHDGEDCCRPPSCNENEIDKEMRTAFDKMGSRGVYIKQVAESTMIVKSVVDALRGTQSNAVLHIVSDFDYLNQLREHDHVQELLMFANAKPDVKYIESVVSMMGTRLSRSKSRSIFESYRCTSTAADRQQQQLHSDSDDGGPEITTLLIKL